MASEQDPGTGHGPARRWGALARLRGAGAARSADDARDTAVTTAGRPATLPTQRAVAGQSAQVPAESAASAAPEASARGSVIPRDPAAAPSVPLVPTQRTAPATPAAGDVAASERTDDSAEPRAADGRRRRVLVTTALAALLVAGTAGGLVVQQAEQRAEGAAQARARVDAALPAVAADAVMRQAADGRTGRAAAAAQHRRAQDAAQQSVEHAAATLAATPHAGDEARGALQGAADALTAALEGTPSPARLRALQEAVAGPEQAALDAQAQWQATEDARLAAERAAAEEAARQAAQRDAGRRSSPAYAPSRAGTSTSPTPSGGGASAAAPPAAPVRVPAGGKVCQGSGGSGAVESGVGAIGAAINAYRATHGLPELAVSRSGSLVTHARNMADAGGIWHSGGDNIVACVSNGSASSMVSAWAASPAHNTQMLRTDVSSMGVGGASLGGWLFGAVVFR